jgi:NAD(P)-dependent dehydrogenase (short-subunit alcohol dehydrogenase family)
MEKEKSLLNKVAIVTGASRGIGRAIAISLARLGANVVVNYQQNDIEAQKTLEEIKSLSGEKSILSKNDIGQLAQVNALVEQTLSEYGRVDILVNNAGIQRAALVHKMSDQDWHQVMDTNINAAFYLSRAVLPSMLASKSGHIVNIISASAYMAHKGASSYVASKYALIGLTKVLALETADKGIFVNAIAPGATDTDMLSSMSEVQRERLLSIVPMKRIASPYEVADMVTWLITQVRYSTGNVFHINGGVIMG